MSAPRPDDSIDAMRHEIDAIDRAFLEALGRRRALVARMRETKARLGLSRVDDAREAVVRQHWLSVARGSNVPDTLARSLLDLVLAESRARVSE